MCSPRGTAWVLCLPKASCSTGAASLPLGGLAQGSFPKPRGGGEVEAQGCVSADNFAHMSRDGLGVHLSARAWCSFPTGMCGNTLPAMAFHPGCERVSATDAWSPRSWRKRSRMSTRPPTSKASSTSSSSVGTKICCKLGCGWLGLCSGSASLGYLHGSHSNTCALRRCLVMGRREGAMEEWRY